MSVAKMLLHDDLVEAYEGYYEDESVGDNALQTPEAFAVWIEDLARFWAEWKAQTPGPHVLIGHSMGCSVIERYLERATARAATVKIMDAITALVEQARGEQAPELRWHQKHERLVERDQAVI